MAFLSMRKVGRSVTAVNGARIDIIRDFDLELADGEFFCLLGPTGCGKTTILNLLAGFDRPTAGEIRLEGAPVTGPTGDRAVVFQGDDSLYPWLNAYDNVAFGPRMRGIGARERRAEAERTLALVGLAGQGEKHPPEMSGGMKQRLQLARVLANQPKILLMDEPFGALDAQTRTIMQDELTRIWREAKRCIVFITHDIDEAVLLGSRVGVMRAGPGSRLKTVVEIGLDRPRDRGDPGFTAHYREIRDLIRAEVGAASAVR